MNHKKMQFTCKKKISWNHQCCNKISHFLCKNVSTCTGALMEDINDEKRWFKMSLWETNWCRFTGLWMMTHKVFRTTITDIPHKTNMGDTDRNRLYTMPGCRVRFSAIAVSRTRFKALKQLYTRWWQAADEGHVRLLLNTNGADR